MRARLRVRKSLLFGAAAATVLATVLSLSLSRGIAHADPLTGAIFTTIFDGSEVNVNQYASKQDVYLDGGPGVGAPDTAAGLPDGTYVFQITDPSGKTLLSSDAAKCREFVVVGGIITSVVAAGGCEHNTSTNVTNGGITVQMFPFDDTPNNGGVYKAWVTTETNFLAGCTALGVSNGLDVVDCGFANGQNGSKHGFIPSDSKTDNFKVKQVPIREIDTDFINAATGQRIEGISETWTDTLGASNTKWSYTNVALHLNKQAHVEAVEDGTHQITLTNQANCTIGEVDTLFPGQSFQQTSTLGPQTVSATISKSNNKQALTWHIYVYCS
jgi:hypothetical protein